MRRKNYRLQPIQPLNFGNQRPRNGSRFLVQQLPPNEFGFPLCQLPDGTINRNVRVSHGTPTSVEVDSHCPPGSVYQGVYHTHPGGVDFPSRQDLRAAVQSGAKVMCIENDVKMSCYLIQRG